MERKNISVLLEDYYNWLRSNTQTITGSTGWTLITLPFPCLFENHIEASIKIEGDKIFISDNGKIIKKLNNVSNIQNFNELAIFNRFMIDTGIQRVGDELICESSFGNFSEVFHFFVTLIQRVNDLFILVDTAKDGVLVSFSKRKIL